MPMEDFAEAPVAEYEDVRRSGQCNMTYARCVEAVVRARGFHSLLRIINQGRYWELLGAYDSVEADRAYWAIFGDHGIDIDPEFDVGGGIR